MAAYCWVDDISHLPVYRDQLQAQLSVTSTGSFYLFILQLLASGIRKGTKTISPSGTLQGVAFHTQHSKFTRQYIVSFAWQEL